jgi:hypothetical protein
MRYAAEALSFEDLPSATDADHGRDSETNAQKTRCATDSSQVLLGVVHIAKVRATHNPIVVALGRGQAAPCPTDKANCHEETGYDQLGAYATQPSHGGQSDSASAP